jgi:calcium/calmodulin-dependent protein kinase (CaM kinase) II
VRCMRRRTFSLFLRIPASTLNTEQAVSSIIILPDRSSKNNMADLARIRVLETNQKLLNAIVSGDYPTYSSLCAEDLSCFESETEGHLVVGLSFHKVFFELSPPTSSVSTTTVVTMSHPHVRFLDDNFTSAICCYTRFNQKVQAGECKITACCETRVWKLDTASGNYKCVHVHKS